MANAKVSALCLAVLACLAAPLDAACGEDALEAAFQAMLRDPNNRGLTRAYIDAAKSAGDYEGAIGALSRLLMADPDQAAWHLELAELYRKISAFSMAELHYRRALALNLDVETRRGIERAIRTLGAGDRLSLTIQSGIEYSSNATGANQATATTIGADLIGGGNLRPVADANAFLTAALDQSFALSDDEALRWNDGLVAYASRQFSLEHQNASYGRLVAGPSLANIGLYGVGEIFGLGSALFMTAAGTDLAVDRALDDRAAVHFDVEWLGRTFHDSVHYPRAGSESGNTITGRAVLSYALDEAASLTARMQASSDSAKEDFASFTEWRSGFAIRYRAFGNWTLGADLSGALRWYRGIDARLGPTTVRRDREWSAGVSLQTPIAEHWTAALGLTRQELGSSLQFYRFGNNVVAGVLQYAF